MAMRTLSLVAGDYLSLTCSGGAFAKISTCSELGQKIADEATVNCNGSAI